jgi:hypothetical protein
MKGIVQQDGSGLNLVRLISIIIKERGAEVFRKTIRPLSCDSAMNEFGSSTPQRSEVILICHVSFLNRKSRDECFAPLEVSQRLSYQHCPGADMFCKQ